MKPKLTAANSRTDLVTDVTPTSESGNVPLLTDETAQASSDVAANASRDLIDSYMNLTSMAWNYYGSVLDQSGFQWAAWWFKWDPEERLAQQISAPVPGLSTAFELGKTVYDTTVDMQMRWLDSWQRFVSWTPFQSGLHGDTRGALQAAATVE